VHLWRPGLLHRQLWIKSSSGSLDLGQVKRLTWYHQQPRARDQDDQQEEPGMK
jgi:hypothetical protein